MLRFSEILRICINFMINFVKMLCFSILCVTYKEIQIRKLPNGNPIRIFHNTLTYIVSDNFGLPSYPLLPISAFSFHQKILSLTLPQILLNCCKFIPSNRSDQHTVHRSEECINYVACTWAAPAVHPPRSPRHNEIRKIITAS